MTGAVMETQVLEPQAVSEARPREATRGFSLVEVVFALTFLAVGIMAVAAMIPMGTRGVTQSRVLTSGLMASQVKLEELKGKNFLALTPGTFSDTTSVFTRTWVVTDSVPMAGCKKIDVVTRWNDSRGTQTAQLVSYVSR
jgi:Tfp pilus assembly protein PilV